VPLRALPPRDRLATSRRVVYENATSIVRHFEGSRGGRLSSRRHQRKRDSVKRCREVFELICAAALGWCSCHCGCWPALAGVDARAPGLAEGMPKFRAGNRIVATRVGARHLGLLALRSASGLGLAGDGAGRPAPTAFNRAGEKLQATGGRAAQGVGRGWSPTPGRARSPPHRGEGLGHLRRVRDGSAGQAASAGPQGRCWSPEATAGSQPVSWTTME
jgi:hypothetical protein